MFYSFLFVFLCLLLFSVVFFLYLLWFQIYFPRNSYLLDIKHQAVPKDLTSSSKFSGSSVLTLQTQRINDEALKAKNIWNKVVNSYFYHSFGTNFTSLSSHSFILFLFITVIAPGNEIGTWLTLWSYCWREKVMISWETLAKPIQFP